MKLARTMGHLELGLHKGVALVIEVQVVGLDRDARDGGRGQTNLVLT